MILRLSDSLSRGLVVVAALLVALWLCFFGIRTAVARYGAEGQDLKQLELAVRLEPSNPAYWYLLGRYHQYNLEEPDSALAEESYQKAIALNPLDTDAWLDLGAVYELDGKSAAARQAFLNAKKSYPGSADVSWRYGNFLLRQGDRIQAYTEMRRAIEADPQRAAAAFSRAYRSNPDIDEIISQLLPAQKSVYTDVVAEAASEGQMAVAQRVWTQLFTINPRLAMNDFDVFVTRLLKAGEFAQARLIWDQGVATMNLPPLFQPQGSVVWDPSFESRLNGRAFSWGFPTNVVQGISTSFDRAEKLSGAQSLRLSFDGKHNPNL
jgi:tetratricopeptide (TPR) repeat protein